jgi:hypothetical protein
MKKILTVLAWCLALNSLHAGWLDALGLGKSPTNATASSAASGLAALSQGQVAEALKQALGDGLQHAVAQLGRSDGFLTNLNVKIPLPEKLKTVEKTLRSLHQEKLADEFVTTMNHAAELAVPQAASVFGEAVKPMSIEDAKAILTGTNDAATQYFRRTTQTNLYAKFYPIVQQATATAGVTAAYKNMLAKVNPGGTLGGLLNSYAGADALNVDAYVTSQALNGLFRLVAEEEARIRQNPVARTTDLMRQVFGAVGK